MSDSQKKTSRWDKISKDLMNRYGITIQQRNEMFNKQDGLCAICGKPPKTILTQFHIDHDHMTGRIRGLLCVKCNMGLGLFKDNLRLLEKAKEYLNANRNDVCDEKNLTDVPAY